MTTKQKRLGRVQAEAPLAVELDALAKMIEYSSVEAKQHGLLLTSHLLDLAVWSLKETQPEAVAADGGLAHVRVVDKPN
jgi:hypothetical protein